MLSNDESKTFEESYERIKNMCYGMALKITRDIGLAEDSVHSAFEKIMEHKEKYFSLPPVKRDSYIVVMVKNKAIDLVRSKKHFEISNIIDTDLEAVSLSDVEKAYEDKEEYEYLIKLIKELPPLYQVVFEMRYVEGFSIDEISQMLDIKKSTVTKQLGRARQKMKKKINVKVIAIIISLLLTASISVLMLNDDIRAAIRRAFPDWLRNSFFINFTNYDGEGSARYYFWKPEYVPDKFFVMQYTHELVPVFEYGLELDEYGTRSSIAYVADLDYYLFVFFSAVWIGEFDEVMGGRIVFPVEWVEHTVIENNGIEYHLLIAHDERGERSLGGVPVNVMWRYMGFDFHMLGTADPDTMLRMAFSVVPF